MSGGRCSGCGYTNASCKKVERHVLTCPDYLQLFKDNPAGALRPTQELERHKMEVAGQDKDAIRSERIAGIRETATRRHDRQQDRWNRKTS